MGHRPWTKVHGHDLRESRRFRRCGLNARLVYFQCLTMLSDDAGLVYAYAAGEVMTGWGQRELSDELEMPRRSLVRAVEQLVRVGLLSQATEGPVVVSDGSRELSHDIETRPGGFGVLRVQRFEGKAGRHGLRVIEWPDSDRIEGAEDDRSGAVCARSAPHARQKRAETAPEARRSVEAPQRLRVGQVRPRAREESESDTDTLLLPPGTREAASLRPPQPARRAGGFCQQKDTEEDEEQRGPIFPARPTERAHDPPSTLAEIAVRALAPLPPGGTSQSALSEATAALRAVGFGVRQRVSVPNRGDGRGGRVDLVADGHGGRVAVELDRQTMRRRTPGKLAQVDADVRIVVLREPARDIGTVPPGIVLVRLGAEASRVVGLRPYLPPEPVEEAVDPDTALEHIAAIRQRLGLRQRERSEPTRIGFCAEESP